MDMSELERLGLLSETEPPFGAYRYFIGAHPASPRYKVCEVCCRRIKGELHFQAEERYFSREEGWTRLNSHSLYGHEKCLRAFRNKEVYSVLPL